ncbi:MAG TPA: STAS domain-containing protein [Polyangia bacterium]|nr:STAS domain-containing protein [Polyangia bacterium]
MSDGRVFHAAAGGRHVLRYQGRVDYPIAPAIERFAQGLFNGNGPTALVFDLRPASMLDSTNLGLLARLAVRVGEGGGHPTIVSTNDDVTDVLRSMGLATMFQISSDDPLLHEVGPGEEIPLEPTDQRDLMRTMLEAHRVLARIDENDSAGFRAVVEGLEAELGPPS